VLTGTLQGKVALAVGVSVGAADVGVGCWDAEGAVAVGAAAVGATAADVGEMVVGADVAE
jgi:hypothetical protein